MAERGAEPIRSSIRRGYLCRVPDSVRLASPIGRYVLVTVALFALVASGAAVAGAMPCVGRARRGDTAPRHGRRRRDFVAVRHVRAAGDRCAHRAPRTRADLRRRPRSALDACPARYAGGAWSPGDFFCHRRAAPSGTQACSKKCAAAVTRSRITHGRIRTPPRSLPPGAPRRRTQAHERPDRARNGRRAALVPPARRIALTSHSAGSRRGRTPPGHVDGERPRRRRLHNGSAGSRETRCEHPAGRHSRDARRRAARRPRAYRARTPATGTRPHGVLGTSFRYAVNLCATGVAGPVDPDTDRKRPHRRSRRVERQASGRRPSTPIGTGRRAAFGGITRIALM